MRLVVCIFVQLSICVKEEIGKKEMVWEKKKKTHRVFKFAYACVSIYKKRLNIQKTNGDVCGKIWQDKLLRLVKFYANECTITSLPTHV